MKLLVLEFILRDQVEIVSKWNADLFHGWTLGNGNFVAVLLFILLDVLDDGIEDGEEDDGGIGVALEYSSVEPEWFCCPVL